MIRRMYGGLKEIVLANVEDVRWIRIGYQDTRQIVQRARYLMNHIHETGDNGLANTGNLAGLFLVHLFETSDNESYQAGANLYFLLNRRDEEFLNMARQRLSDIHQVTST